MKKQILLFRLLLSTIGLILLFSLDWRIAVGVCLFSSVNKGVSEKE